MSDMHDAMMYAAQATAKYEDRVIENYIKSRYHTLCRCPETIALKGFWGPTFSTGCGYGCSHIKYRCLIAPGFFRCPRAPLTHYEGIAV